MYTTPPPPAPTRPRPVAGLGTAAIALGTAVLAVCLLRLVAIWLAHDALFRGAQDATTLERVHSAVTLLLTATILFPPTLLAAVAVSLVWVHRARTNAGLLSPYLRFRYSPASSAWLLLVPIANGYFIGPILGDICAGSSPYGPDDRGARMVRTFWASTITAAAGSAVGYVAVSLGTERFLGAVGVPDESVLMWTATVSTVFETVVYVLAIGCTVLFARVVRRISRMQTALLAPPAPRW